MPQIKLYIEKNLEENAGIYYDEAKKLKKKIEGAHEALKRHYAKLEELQKKNAKLEAKESDKQLEKAQQSARKKEWYEKFRWFISSEGFLCIGGKDSTSNEIIIKKHTDKDDIVFHTDMAGSPFFVVKVNEKINTVGKDVEEKNIKEEKQDVKKTTETPTKQTLQECADATACYSRAWKLGLAALNVFYVKPEQVSKEANTGEYVAKGAFIIRGKTNYLQPDMKIAVSVGSKENEKIAGKIIAGPVSAIKKNADKDAKVLLIIQSNEKSSDIAKFVQKRLGTGSLDEIIAMLPTGGCKVIEK
ncbi:DUF814 domain-containing protein [Candidatus Woesearchaeota archaeon]|nr:DUF814 domain-containing protein [Candidatus Woesearchaeota archaeon]